jgi:phosphotransferase system enzyme I (PtsP)
VRNRYDSLNTSFITFLKQIISRCEISKTPLSFCGEDAGRPIEAICLAAIGIRSLSMRAPSIGPVKSLLRKVNLNDIKTVINSSINDGESSVRQAVINHLNGR